MQICFITSMITMVVRLDAYSVVYGIFLGVLLTVSRKRCACLWPFYMSVLILLLGIQYFHCLGIPPGLCTGSSVHSKSTNTGVFFTASLCDAQTRF